MSKTTKRARRAGIVLLACAALAGALGYGVAQSSPVTQAEWAVYMAQALELDWNLPPNAKSHHYLSRLNWTNSVQFRATQMLDGSTAVPQVDGTVGGSAVPSEALYEMATLRPGDYGFRVKLGGGGAVLKVGETTYDLYQPTPEPKWVDLERVPLDPGNHKLSLLLGDTARADSLGVTPPCMLPVEPVGGWEPLAPLKFRAMAMTLAKALELEKELPAIGQPQSIRGEDFRRTLEFPLEQDLESNDEPFWLTAGGSIVTAVAHFEVPESGVYSIETRYLSSRPVRWNMDNCLRVVTCPVAGAQIGQRRSMALELEAGTHELEVILGPGAKLDRVEIQRRDGSPEEYIAVVESEGFKMRGGDDQVSRRESISAARRLRDRFGKLSQLRCDDGLVALERMAEMVALQNSSSSQQNAPEGIDRFGNVPDSTVGTTQLPASDGPLVPVEDDGNPSASPVTP